MNHERDLVLENPDYPSHIQIRHRNDDNDNPCGAVLWLGNENTQEECDVTLTNEDIAWLVDALQRILLARHPTEPQNETQPPLSRAEAVAKVLEKMQHGW